MVSNDISNRNGLARLILALSLLSVFTISPHTASLGQSNCAAAKLAHTGMVSLDTKVSWRPASCKLVLQAYQQGQLVGEQGKQAGVASDAITVRQLIDGKTGRTEIKIWIPGASKPADAVWVTVQEKLSN